MQNPRWEIMTCFRQDVTLNIIAEVKPYGYLTLEQIKKVVEEMLDLVNDNGEIDYEWEICPAIITEFPKIHNPILEIRLVQTKRCEL